MADDEFEEQLRQETIAKASGEDLEGRTYTDADGTVFEWDVQKKAWFPKIDDDFIAQYQMNYGTDENNADSTDQQAKGSDFVEYPDFNPPNNDPNSEEYYNYYYEYFSKYGPSGDAQQGAETSQGETSNQSQEAQGLKRPANKQEGWFDFDTEKGTHVYVSGLPLDVTAEEFRDLMNKYGLIMYDHQTRQPKIKLYMDDQGQPKGDGLCVFIKPESVELCLKLLDGMELRGSTVHAERATFTMKGNYDPSKKRKKLSNKEKRKLKEKQEKLFAWNPERQPDTRLKHEQVVVLRNMFDPHDFDEDPSLINDVVEDVRSEAARFGDVKKVNIYDQHADGVVTVKFKDAEMADACIAALNGRFFAKRRILASQWDGKAKFEVQESEAERQARLDRWAAFLEGKKAREEQAQRDKAAKADQAAAAASAAEGTPSTVEPASSSRDPQTGGQDTPNPPAPAPNPPPAQEEGEGVEKNTQGASQPS